MQKKDRTNPIYFANTSLHIAPFLSYKLLYSTREIKSNILGNYLNEIAGKHDI